MGKVKRFFNSQKVAPFVFVLPFLLSLIIFWAYPLITGIIMSFQDITFGGRTFVGVKHYTKLMQDKFFRTAVLNSVEYMVLTIVLLIPIPMMLAVLLESRITKAKGVWKVIMYIPALTSVVISGMLFRMMFSFSGASDHSMRPFTYRDFVRDRSTSLSPLFSSVYSHRSCSSMEGSSSFSKNMVKACPSSVYRCGSR